MDKAFLEKLNIPAEAAGAILEEWEKQEAAHRTELAELEFSQKLDTAIAGMRGRSGPAIRALLDMEGLRKAENMDAGIQAALEKLRQDSGYLFETEQVPPAYAPGVGSAAYRRDYTQEELGRMSMAEYRAYRAGR